MEPASSPVTKFVRGFRLSSGTDSVRVSIVIPAYNAEKTLDECLTACLNQSYPEIEVIVVDDDSFDRTREIAERHGVRYLWQRNAGPAAARNRGANAATGDIVAFTDADCVPRPDWVAQLVQHFDEGIASVGGTYDIANPDRLLARMVHEEIMRRHAHLDGEVDFLGSFNLAVRSDVFREVGGFDPFFTAASGEDNDLAYRLQDAGWRLWFTRKATVSHYHPTNLWRYLRTQARHGYWRVMLYRKHPGRMSGDRYAGNMDFAGPPLSLVVVGLLALTPVVRAVGRGGTAFTAFSAAFAFLYSVARCGMPIGMVSNTGDVRMLLFIPVVLMRDVARAAGMLRGTLSFHR